MRILNGIDTTYIIHHILSTICAENTYFFILGLYMQLQRVNLGSIAEFPINPKSTDGTYIIYQILLTIHKRWCWCKVKFRSRDIYWVFSPQSLSYLCVMLSNGNIFRVTGHLCGEFTSPGELGPHKGQRRGVLMFSVICVWIDNWVNNREACHLRRYPAHYDVIVMLRNGVINTQRVSCEILTRFYFCLVLWSLHHNAW